MLEGGYFDGGTGTGSSISIPMFRCTDACQFGLSSNTTLTKQFGSTTIRDDPLWLPTGPENRFYNNSKTKMTKIKRYPKGVLTHAGSGNNSRGVQFVLTLKPNKYMGGGSPWEVPLGEVVEVGVVDGSNDNSGGGGGGGGNINNNNGKTKTKNDFVDVSLPDIYTGYGEKGPGQGLLRREGVSESVREKWPLLDYILQCSIVDRLIVDDDNNNNSSNETQGE